MGGEVEDADTHPGAPINGQGPAREAHGAN